MKLRENKEGDLVLFLAKEPERIVVVNERLSLPFGDDKIEAFVEMRENGFPRMFVQCGEKREIVRHIETPSSIIWCSGHDVDDYAWYVDQKKTKTLLREKEKTIIEALEKGKDVQLSFQKNKNTLHVKEVSIKKI